MVRVEGVAQTECVGCEGQSQQIRAPGKDDESQRPGQHVITDQQGINPDDPTANFGRTLAVDSSERGKTKGAIHVISFLQIIRNCLFFSSIPGGWQEGKGSFPNALPLC